MPRGDKSSYTGKVRRPWRVAQGSRTASLGDGEQRVTRREEIWFGARKKRRSQFISQRRPHRVISSLTRFAVTCCQEGGKNAKTPGGVGGD